MKTIDACGRACPEPVLMTKRALESSPEGVTVLADNAIAAANITRFAANAGFKLSQTEQLGIYTLTLTK
ncbi:MAG: sulfurtransferase TusA family protein [Christensenellaceae bacterium]|jgi:TusA-related sulfurtransferase|nr:sulfurtransferase TusA family protein [Christensenellaceae bacterium]